MQSSGLRPASLHVLRQLRVAEAAAMPKMHKSLIHTGSFVRFSSAAEAASAASSTTEEWVPPPHPTKFRSPKVEELYFKLISIPNRELYLVSKRVMSRVGVDLDKERAKKAAFVAKGGKTNANAENAEDAAPVEVKTAFDLKLVGFDAKSKIKVIKEVRAIADLGLKEAKELVEGAPKIIRKGLKQEQAEELKAKLIEAGAEIEIV
jgi:ribosomal protein L7/L12